MKAKELITVFNDLTLEYEMKLRDNFNKVFVPELRVQGKVKNVKFEFITEGLVAGKVLGKKAYEVKVPCKAYNSVLNSYIVTDRVTVKDSTGVKEYNVNWPKFFFMNPDKVKVKIRELRRKQRREGWKGKSFKSIFWDWDGAVTLRVILEFEDGSVGYYDLLRVVFVYAGNASTALEWANEQKRKYKHRIKSILNYIRGVYGVNVADTARQYIYYVVTGNEEAKKKEIELKNLLGNMKAFNFVIKMINTVIRLKKELNQVASLMNRASGADFIVLVYYNRLYNPIYTENGLKIKPTKFYEEIKVQRVEQEDRWFDEFGNQVFIITSDWEKELARLGFSVKEEIGSYIMDKKFRPLGKFGFLKHEVRSSGVPPEDVTVEKVEQATAKWLLRNVRVKRPKTRVEFLTAERDGMEYVVYIVRPLNRAGRFVIANYDHRQEGKDRVIAHVNTDKYLIFVHKL